MKLLEKLSIGKSLNKKEKETDILRRVRLAIPAQSASITPPLGPALGQFGLNIVEFCKQFNEKSALFDHEVLLNVVITLFRNKSFVFEYKGPSIAFLVYEYYNSYLINRKMKEALVADKFAEDELFKSLANYDYPAKLPLSVFYQIVLVRSFFLNEKPEIVADMVFSTLSTMKIHLYNDIS